MLGVGHLKIRVISMGTRNPGGGRIVQGPDNVIFDKGKIEAWSRGGIRKGSRETYYLKRGKVYIEQKESGFLW